MERLGEDARRLLAAAGAPEAGPLSRITDVWPETVGAPIARSAWPLRLGRDGALHVATVSSTWTFELDRLAPELLGRLRTALGADAPTTLRFAVGPVPEAGAVEEPPEPVDVPPTSPDARRQAASIAAGIGDPELRELVARAAAASLSRPTAGRGFW
jgi:hypothetical protein